MSTLMRLLTPIACGVMALGACTAPPSAVGFRVELGGLGLSWPQDVEPLHIELQRLTEGVCGWASTVHVAARVRCRSELATGRKQVARSIPGRS